MAFRIQSMARTDTGKVRRNNEDSFCDRHEDGLWAVADGMGGHEHGEWASAEVAQAMASVYLPANFDDACLIIAGALHGANARIFETGSDRGIQMGSTAVVLFVRDGRFAVFWVGDSRAYLLRGGTLHRLTRDHTQVQEMIERGLLGEAEAEGHPMAHVLSRAMGVEQSVEVDVITDEAWDKDVFLLCSDGLTGPLSEAMIGEALALPDHHAAADRLVADTLDRGAPDNVTLVMVALDETTLLSLPASGPVSGGVQ
jgi:serine/threonine protein phosphatase PrpC